MGDTSTFARQHCSSRSLLRAVLGTLGVSTCLLLVVPEARGQSPELNALLTRNNCMACHTWDKKLVGPPFNAVRARYSASDLPYLASKIRNGGDKVWGGIPMPRNDQVSQSDAELMAAGILGVNGYLRPEVQPVALPDDPPSVGGAFRLSAPANSAPSSTLIDSRLRYANARELLAERRDQLTTLKDAAKRKRLQTSDKPWATHCTKWLRLPTGETALANTCETDIWVELCSSDDAPEMGCRTQQFGMLMLPARPSQGDQSPPTVLTGFQNGTAWACKSPYVPFNTRMNKKLDLWATCAKEKG